MNQFPKQPSKGGYERHTHSAATPVKIGKYRVWLGGADYIDDVSHVDTVVSLNGRLPRVPFGTRYDFVDAELADYGGVPTVWREFITNVAAEIIEGKKFMGFCTGGHGRTGCFAASLVAVLCPEVADPIEYIRKGYCDRAVESSKQIEAVFELAGRPVPKKYERAVSTHLPLPPYQKTLGKNKPQTEEDDDEAFFRQYYTSQQPKAVQASVASDEDLITEALHELMQGKPDKFNALESRIKRST